MDPGKKGWKRVTDSDFFLLGLLALLSLILYLFALKGFGYFRDELYYIACSNHLDFGYVDHPPLSILLLRLVRMVVGDSRFALRLLPALAGSLYVFFAGLLARELGGKKTAVSLAGAAAFAQTGMPFLFHIYSMNFLDALFWPLCFFLLIRLIKTGNPRFWPVLGLAVGLAFENKVSILMLCFGLAAGILFTPLRKKLRTPWFWAGAAIAAVLALPYFLWNAGHDWPHLEFMRNAKAFKMTAVSPLGFFSGQALFSNPLNLFVWLAGLWYFFFHSRGKTYRLFGWTFLITFILVMVLQGKDYYLAPIYPILFAGGALLFEAAKSRWILRWVRPVLLILLVSSALVFRPFALPLLSAEKTISLLKAFGMSGYSPGERHEKGLLPQHLADMFGWEEMAATTAEIYQSLSPEEQAQCVIFVRNYGEAGAIDFFGSKYGLPKATCGHNSYWLWGPPKDRTGQVMIVFGESPDLQENLADLSHHFEQVEHAATFHCRYCMPYENNRQIFLCRGFKHSLPDIWPGEKNFI